MGFNIEEDKVVKGVERAMDFWLSQHSEITVVGAIEKAVGDAFKAWLEDNSPVTVPGVLEKGIGGSFKAWLEEIETPIDAHAVARYVAIERAAAAVVDAWNEDSIGFIDKTIAKLHAALDMPLGPVPAAKGKEGTP